MLSVSQWKVTLTQHSFNGAQLCSDYCSVISFRVRQPNVGEKREVDPVNGFQIISYLADADAAESPGFTAASEYTGHCIGLSHTALTGLVHWEVFTKSYSLCGQLGNRYLGYGEIIFFLSDTKQSHSLTSHFVFSAIFKMAAKHDSITKQSYILRLFFLF